MQNAFLALRVLLKICSVPDHRHTLIGTSKDNLVEVSIDWPAALVKHSIGLQFISDNGIRIDASAGREVL